jgi:uncharacterized membrane protein
MVSPRTSHLMRCVALLLLFWGAVIHFLVTLPPFEGSDEDKHFGYVTHLRDTGQFPDPRQSLQLPARQASGQAPLYYVLVRLWSELAPPYTWDGNLPLNPYVNPVRPVMYWPDNANVFLFGPDQIPYNPPLVSALLWQRFLSPMMGMLAVSLAHCAARPLLSRVWAQFAMLLFAFNPVLIFMFSYVTNDAAAILASAAVTFCLLGLLRRNLTRRSLFISGVVIGLGVLTKANVLVFAPIAVGVLLVRIYRVEHRQTLKRPAAEESNPPRGLKNAGKILIEAASLVLPIALIGAPWYVWNGIQYGDPFGIQPHARTFWALPTPRSMSEALLVTLADGAYQIRSLWYGVASGVVMSSHTVLVAPLVLLVLGIIGYVRRWRAILRLYRFEMLVLLLACAAIFLAYVRWLMAFDSVTGRLLLPGYPALVLLVTLGLARGWGSNVMRVVRLVGGSTVVFGAVILSGYVTLPWFYTLFTMSPDAVQSLAGEAARFGEVEFMGYRIEPQRLTEGIMPRAVVCWRSLRDDARLPVPYAFAFHITGQDGTVYYGRDSLPGLGLYTNWQPGRAFCDRFALEQRQALVPGRGYRVAVGLFDPATQERVPEDDGKTFVGWIAAPGEMLTDAERASALYNFEGVYLLDLSFIQDDDSLNVGTDWGTGEWQPRSLTVFIHVADDSGQPVTQLDLPLGGEDYPSVSWGKHERTYSAEYEVPIPSTLSPGEYPILLGVYDSQTLIRLNVVDAGGVPQADNVIHVGTLTR